MDGYKLLTARFVDNERKTVEALWVSNIGDEIIPIVCEASDDDVTYKDLLTRLTLDDLHENTYQWIKDQQAELKQIYIAVAKEEGLIYDIDQAMNSNIYKAIVKSLFQTFDPTEHKEQLFLLKLELFELDMVKNCGDRDLKKKLRKSPSIIESVKVAIEIFETSQAQASPSSSD